MFHDLSYLAVFARHNHRRSWSSLPQRHLEALEGKLENYIMHLEQLVSGAVPRPRLAERDTRTPLNTETNVTSEHAFTIPLVPSSNTSLMLVKSQLVRAIFLKTCSKTVSQTFLIRTVPNGACFSRRHAARQNTMT
ncbi:hypothetical protein RRG08_057415 [Elysia crispata]|uniref:Uncharacterized protein n=1 Tax=Elysia crispata TaxID=231223 RepID=A0AAE1AF94_9GAST|nr:hypothetical protein RRG08_057415 [Elysia crispata]